VFTGPSSTVGLRKTSRMHSCRNLQSEEANQDIEKEKITIKLLIIKIAE